MDTIKNNLFFILLLLTLFIMIGCSEDKIGPLESNSTPPGSISNVTVKNLPASAQITYTLPKDQDLLYVKAVYPLRSGILREVRASYYTSTMTLDGFADTEEHEVKVYAVNRSEVESEPIIVKVQPLENPIWEVYRNLKVSPDFSGVRITSKNPNMANITIEVIKKDSLGKWEPLLPYIYSSSKDIGQTTRGMDTVPQEFGVSVRDRFLNYTDTLYATISPLYEEMLTKSLFKEIRLPGDAGIQAVTPGMPTIWDGDTYNLQSMRLMTEPADPNPQWITFDMGQLAKLSRFKLFNYSEYMSDGNHQFYYRGQMRFFEVWGCPTVPPADGSWDSWLKIASLECIKPSGLPYGENSTEDWDKAIAGFDFDFDLDAPKVRYIRIKCLENWQGTTWLDILELNIYGDMR